MSVRAHASAPEEIVAAERAILALSVGVGGMATLISLAVGDPLAFVGIPSLVAFVLLARGAIGAAAWAAVVGWLIFATRAPNEAILVPLAMSVICLAIAIGPERFGGWLRDDVGGSHGIEPGEERGWIEERLG
jgi:hypothetical protein